MAFWNAPLDDPDHAAHAVEAGLAMVAAVGRLNEELAAEAETTGVPAPRIAIGVGINTGTCVVGNMGSDMRFDYTALGDAVNLAARLEGQTRLHGVDLILGEETAHRVKDRFALVELGSVTVKGRREPVPVFTAAGGRAPTSRES
ncbi:Adenylate cyclase [Lutibaculum baratangense AMV1]|uniref:Adenylate cyclase n=1 Tax=Lutibaculum baratangense AMV1 TaxID=631454 RepID=V4QTJ0_9HYPH|nr:Adenylate cyclase [Lutibaculum baratangense AMV1]